MSALPFLHPDLGLTGVTEVVVKVTGTALLMLHIAAFVLLGETTHPRAAKLRWTAAILLLPLIGPIVYLHRHRDQLHLPAAP